MTYASQHEGTDFNMVQMSPDEARALRDIFLIEEEQWSSLVLGIMNYLSRRYPDSPMMNQEFYVYCDTLHHRAYLAVQRAITDQRRGRGQFRGNDQDVLAQYFDQLREEYATEDFIVEFLRDGHTIPSEADDIGSPPSYDDPGLPPEEDPPPV